MAASKKRKLAPPTPGDNQDGDAEDDSDLSNSEEDISDENIQLDMEAYNPTPDDFHGIKQLLHQLFLKAHINLSEMASLIIEQANVTSVVKNVDCDDEADGEEEEEDNETFVFGVSSVINLAVKKDKACVKELKTYLLTKCHEACQQEEYLHFKGLLEDEERHLGYVINERVINLPGQISVPIFKSLTEDMIAADLDNKVKKYNFDNFLIISKTYVDKTSSDSSTINFSNVEEEIIMEYASFKFDFSVTEEKDTELTGAWGDEDMECDPLRRVMIFPADKWTTIVDRLKSQFQGEM